MPVLDISCHARLGRCQEPGGVAGAAGAAAVKVGWGCLAATACSQSSRAANLAISYVFTYTARVLFCALNPGACLAAARLMPVPSPEDDQFVEPSNATMPSRTPPFVWLICAVDDSPTAKSLAKPSASCATSVLRIAFSVGPLACDLSSVTWTITEGFRTRP